ncbi:hypothetical protein LJR027_003238 [Terrabacter sp. LjRoot27]|uniref:DUF6882 domain-containing protein n=1 Tax=Terrabacter sp. LjRoot27 TaxID=3342306 RepID=UPI003ECFEC8C
MLSSVRIAAPRWQDALMSWLRRREDRAARDLSEASGRTAAHQTDPVVTEALEGELNDLLNLGNDLAQRATRANVEWGLGTAERYDFDQETGLITFTWPDRVATAPFQFLGSYAHRPGTWLWSWANDSIDDRVKSDSIRLRDHGIEHGRDILRTEHLHVAAEDGDCLALLGIALSSTSSFYRAPGELNTTYVTFGDVTFTDASGVTTVVRDLRASS